MLDELDVRIIDLLQEDARLSREELASRLGVDAATVASRVEGLEEAGVLKGYSAIVDPSKVGLDFTAVTLIQVEGDHLVEVEDRIAGFDEVCCVYFVTGEFDVAVMGRFTNRDDINSFIKGLLSGPYVKKTVTSIVLNTVKEDFRVRVPRTPS
jgi:Lrp/AsnC family transcriptional regulator for asnA, asnC and gidA